MVQRVSWNLGSGIAGFSTAAQRRSCVIGTECGMDSALVARVENGVCSMGCPRPMPLFAWRQVSMGRSFFEERLKRFGNAMPSEERVDEREIDGELSFRQRLQV